MKFELHSAAISATKAGAGQKRRHRDAMACIATCNRKTIALVRRSGATILSCLSRSSWLMRPISRIRSTTGPRLAGQSCRNGRRGLERHVRPAEIVPRDEQREHQFVILPFLAEVVRQAS